MSEKYKKICKYLNYVEYLLILASTVSISAFDLLVCVLVDIISSAVGINVCEFTAGFNSG